jgi:hypothetical protein
VIGRIEAVHPEVARALRAMSGMERLRLAHETWELTRVRLAAYLAAHHSDWRQDEIENEVARRLLGDDALWEEVQSKWSRGR